MVNETKPVFSKTNREGMQQEMKRIADLTSTAMSAVSVIFINETAEPDGTRGHDCLASILVENPAMLGDAVAVLTAAMMQVPDPIERLLAMNAFMTKMEQLGVVPRADADTQLYSMPTQGNC
jgi:hypothetical protein